MGWRALALALCLGAGVTHAATFNVDNTGDAGDANAGNGVCATGGGVCTLRAAIQEANALGGADTINVPAGTYNTTSELTVSGATTIVGAGSSLVTIDANDNSRVFRFTTSASSMSGVTVRDGNAGSNSGGGITADVSLTLTDVTVTSNRTTGHGGGIFMDTTGTNLTMTNCTVSDNNADRATGINFKVANGTLTLTDVTVSGNIGTGEGGGIRVFGNSSTIANLTRVTVDNNTAPEGAGILLLNHATSTLTDVTISNNTATSGDGGGLRVEFNTANVTLDRVTASGNSATNGGGIQFKSLATASVQNSTVSGNTASNQAGGVRIEQGTVTFTNTTIVDNEGDSNGGNIRNSGGTARFRNSIVANPVDDNDCNGSITDLGNNLDSDGTCGFATTANPLLGPLQDNGGETETHALLSGSPAIDTGTNTGCPAVDQTGTARPQDGDLDLTATCDIGAYEFPIPTGISGRVFEDADFAGTASGWDGGVTDLALPAVDVELYTLADAYLTSTTTDASGNYAFALADGTYKVRVRSATIGDTDTPPAGGFNACVGASTCASPLPEMTWGNGSAAYGGQTGTGDDTATGDNLGPGDTWLSATVAGSITAGVDFGFTYNLIVNTTDDANAANARSAQGSLRQFVKNANAIGTAGSTTANASEFRMQVATNQSAGGDAWWRITAAAAMTPFTDSGTTLDASTQVTNAGSTANSRGPEIELFGNGVAGSGLEVNSVANTTLRELTINSFQDQGIWIHGAGATGTDVFGCYIGTDAIGENALPNLDGGIWVNDNTSTTDIGSATPGDGNVISGNGNLGTEAEISVGLLSASVTIVGNKIGTDRTGTQALGGSGPGISLSGANGVTIGGSTAPAGNIVSGNGGDGIRMTNFVENVAILGNSIGVGSAGNETTLGNGSDGIFITSFQDPSNIVVGGTGSGEGNVIAHNGSEGVHTQTSGGGDSVQGNTIRDNGAGGVRSLTDSLLIAKNLVANNNGDGLLLVNDGGTGANNNRVYQNTIHGSSGDGIEITGTGVLIRNTIVTGSGGFGINVNGGGMTESDNLVTDASTSPANTAGRSNVALDAGDLNFDPRYDDAGNGDFTLDECLSPAVEWGADLGGDQPDMNGAVAGNFNGSAPDQGAFETTCTGPAIADLEIVKSDAPDPAPSGGPLIYTLVVTNNGPGTATNVTVTDNLPASTTYQSATPSQGSCSGTGPVSCNFGAILNGGTASVEIQVVTSGSGMITNNASVTADQGDLVPGNNADSEDTDVVVGGTSDLPLSQYRRIHGFVDTSSTGGTLRTDPNTGNPCLVGATDSASLAGIPAGATVSDAWLYWAGSGATVDDTVDFDGASVTADRTFTAQFVLGANNYDFFGGFEDVTAQVAAKRNGSYSFGALTVDTGNPFCAASAVVAGWALIVVYEDNSLTGKTLLLYDGFDIVRNDSAQYTLTGIWAADPPEAKATYVVWEGDETLSGTDEKLEFNGTGLSDGSNPVNNVYNSTINAIGSTTTYGVDVDTFDVAGEVSAGDTSATTEVFAGPDLVILNAVMLQVKSNIIVGRVFEDVNYGGGAGRDRATAVAAAPTFTVDRSGAVVELYDAAGNFLRTTTTAATGQFGFAGLIDGSYSVRVVNDTVISSRPGATGSEVPVQTFRTDASTGAAVPVTGEVGGASPAAQDSPANAAMANLGTLTAQSVTTALITTGVAVPGVDFGYNFDTIVNTNDAAQGSLRRALLNANALTNANLAQAGLTAGVEHTLFMIPSDADPFGRTQDPGFDAARGVAVITPDSLLPAIVDADTAVDGTTQTTSVGNTNAATLGTGGTVGTAALALPQLAGPEIEIVDDLGLTVGLDLQADDATVRGIAIYGFGSANNDGNIRLGTGAGTNFTGALIEDNAIGFAADSFTDPDLAVAGSGTAGSGIVIEGADGGTVRRNLVAFSGRNGVYLTSGADDWTVEQNEVRRNGLDADRLDGIGTTGTSTRTTIRRNLIADSQGAGVDFFASLGDHTVIDNTVEDNGWGGVEPVGIRMFGTDSTIATNVIRNQTGAGVLAVVQDLGFTQTPALRNSISQNAFSGNGANAIDLQTTLDVIAPGDGITLNDGTLLGDSSNATVCGTDATHGNNGLDTPIVDLVLMTGGTATIRGRACPGASVELYRAVADGDASDTLGAIDYGEGVQYLATAVAAAGTGEFEATGVTGLGAGDAVSAIAIDPAGNTSEFSNNATYQSLALVKRAFQIDGTPIASGSTLPAGLPVRFLLYIDNPGMAVADVSVEDTLAALFAYQAGSLKVDTSLDSSGVCPGGACDDAAIFAKVDGTPDVCGQAGSECTDTQDGDPVSVSGATIHAGDATQAGNAQLDVPAGKVLAISFTIVMQ